MRKTGILLLALLPLHLYAQAGPPMITDDPGTPGDGHWEINLAALSDRTQSATTYQWPLIDANYGVGDRIQLKLETPWIVQRNDGAGTTTGLGNGLAGVKWRFYDEGEDGWQVSTYPQMQFNYPGTAHSRRDGLAESGVGWLVPLEVQRDFGGLEVGFEVGRWLYSAQPDTWIAGLVLGHNISKEWEIMAELHDEATLGFAHDELIFNAGLRWNFSERFSILASAGRDLHNSLGETDTLLSYFALQMRL